jgi:alkylation response protein AidB-like acyl-CoA dehydrogenase
VTLEDEMPRNLYTPDHEAFRETAREFVERSLKPRAQQFIEARCIGREVWIEAGKQGLLGLEVPEAYGGSEARDFRFNAVFAEELSKFNAAASSCFGIHTDCVAPYLVDLGTVSHAREPTKRSLRRKV